MRPIVQKIKSRGYWRFLIRPAKFDEKRLESVSKVLPLVRSLSVQIRGWDFPHIEREEDTRVGTDWVEQDCDWAYHIESWRMYQSGQFAYLMAMCSDWDDKTGWRPRPPPGPIMGVVDLVTTFVEFFEFAAAFAVSEAGDEQICVEAVAHGLDERQLFVDSPRRARFMTSYKCMIDEFPQSRVYGRNELAAEPLRLAAAWAREMLLRFRWEPAQEILDDLIHEFRKRG